MSKAKDYLEAVKSAPAIKLESIHATLDRDGYIVFAGGTGQIHVPVDDAEKLGKWLYELTRPTPLTARRDRDRDWDDDHGGCS